MELLKEGKKERRSLCKITAQCFCLACIVTVVWKVSLGTSSQQYVLHADLILQVDFPPGSEFGHDT